jgi:hypothetical protein
MKTMRFYDVRKIHDDTRRAAKKCGDDGTSRRDATRNPESPDRKS